MKDNMLEVGDVLFMESHTFGMSRHTITRVTAKRAYSRVHESYEMEFNREVFVDHLSKDFYVTARGERYNRYFLSTPELVQRFHVACLKGWARNFNFSNLSVEQLEAIKKIATEGVV